MSAEIRVSGVAVLTLDKLERLQRKRDARGAEWCMAKGLGKERMRLRANRPQDAQPIFRRPEVERALRAARADAEMIIADICRGCGRCPLARE